MSEDAIRALTEKVANLTAELNATNETVDMLYQRTSRFSAQADKHEATSRRLQNAISEMLELCRQNCGSSDRCYICRIGLSALESVE